MKIPLPPPSNWQDFEDLCCDLWRKLLQDPNTIKNGRSGQKQYGVDISGRQNQGKEWTGIQCKWKNSFGDTRVTEDELIEEVNKAKEFIPKLTHFILATTGKKDAIIEEKARVLTEEHKKQGLFSVTVFGWEDVETRLCEHSTVLLKPYKDLANSINSSIQPGDNDDISNNIIKEETDSSYGTKHSGVDEVSTKIRSLIGGLVSEDMEGEYDKEINHSRVFIKSNKPQAALTYLTELKNRIWDKIQNHKTKYRLLTNLASSNLLLDKYTIAANQFIEAYQYNKTDKEARFNFALAYLLLDDISKAKELAEQLITDYADFSKPYILIIETSPTSYKLEQIINQIPELIRNKPEVAFAIAKEAEKRGDIECCINWLEIAVENDEENLFDLKGTLGEIILQSILNTPLITSVSQISDETKEKLILAVEYLEDAWSGVKDTELREYRTNWLCNIGVAKKYLGNLDEAKANINLALEIQPENPIFKFQKALLLYEAKNMSEAKTILYEIRTSKKIPNAAFLLAEILDMQGENTELLKVMEELISSEIPEKYFSEVSLQLICKYIEFGETDKARITLDNCKRKFPNNLVNFVGESRIKRYVQDDKGQSIVALLDGINNISEETTLEEKLTLADELYFLEQYGEAAKLYEQSINKSIYNIYTERLISSYHFIGETEKTAVLCESLRENYGSKKYFTEIEIAIFEKIDLPKAVEICEYYLNEHPEDADIQIRLAYLNLRINTSDSTIKVDEFLESLLDSSFNINNIKLEYVYFLAFMFTERNQEKKALDLMYELRRKHYDNDFVHQKYISLILNVNKELLDQKQVYIDCAVCLEDSSGNKSWYIIENRSASEKNFEEEINLYHELSQPLIGKKCGESIDLPSKEKLKIIAITSKYSYAYSVSFSLFQDGKIELKGVEKVNFEVELNDGTVLENKGAIFLENLSKREEFKKGLLSYHLGKTSIGATANEFKINVMHAYYLIRNLIGFKCCNGDKQERKRAHTLLDKGSVRIVIDITSLLTLFELEHLKLTEKVVKLLGKFAIAQSTVDLIQNIKAEYESASKQEIIMEQGSGELLEEGNTSEMFNLRVEHLDKLNEYLQNYCEVVPVHAALNLNSLEKDLLDKEHGTSFIDTALIANETEFVLLIEDANFRDFTKEKFHIEGIWIQILLQYCLSKEYLSQEIYDKAIVHLTCMNYRYISNNKNSLYEAASISRWKVNGEFSIIAHTLSGLVSEKLSSLYITTYFLKDLYLNSFIPERNRNDLTRYLLVILIQERSRAVIDELINCIHLAFDLIPAHKDAVLSCINNWRNIHLRGRL